MPKPFKNAPEHNSTLSDDYLIGIQTGTTSGESGLPQMKYVKLSKVKEYAARNIATLGYFRGKCTNSVPGNLANNDYFYAGATFTEDSKTFTSGHFYMWDGTDWTDISPSFSGCLTSSDVIDSLESQATDKPLSANMGHELQQEFDNLDAALNGKVNVSDIVDNLTSSATNKPLSANQGKALKQLNNNLKTAIENTTVWNIDQEAEVTFEGDGAGTWEIMERQIPTESNDGIFLCMDASAPTNSSSAGLKGQFYVDENYFYICIANNTWRRVALSTF